MRLLENIPFINNVLFPCLVMFWISCEPMDPLRIATLRVSVHRLWCWQPFLCIKRMWLFQIECCSHRDRLYVFLFYAHEILVATDSRHSNSIPHLFDYPLISNHLVYYITLFSMAWFPTDNAVLYSTMGWYFVKIHAIKFAATRLFGLIPNNFPTQKSM